MSPVYKIQYWDTHIYLFFFKPHSSPGVSKLWLVLDHLF